MTFAQAEVHAGAWKLDANEVWNIPTDENEVRFEMKTIGPWSILTSLRALVIDLDGRIYGVRTMSQPREDGYVQRGYVSVGGKKRRCFTSSKLFERADGSLCDVAVFIMRRQTT